MPSFKIYRNNVLIAIIDENDYTVKNDTFIWYDSYDFKTGSEYNYSIEEVNYGIKSNELSAIWPELEPEEFLSVEKITRVVLDDAFYLPPPVLSADQVEDFIRVMWGG